MVLFESGIFHDPKRFSVAMGDASSAGDDFDDFDDFSDSFESSSETTTAAGYDLDFEESLGNDSEDDFDDFDHE